MRYLGGDAVGMSTVPEIVTAAKLGIKTLTLSCLTNYAAGISRSPLTHHEVVMNAKKFDTITFSEVLKKNLRVMDLTAITLCKENNIPIKVFSIKNSDKSYYCFHW